MRALFSLAVLSILAGASGCLRAVDFEGNCKDDGDCSQPAEWCEKKHCEPRREGHRSCATNDDCVLGSIVCAQGWCRVPCTTNDDCGGNECQSEVCP